MKKFFRLLLLTAAVASASIQCYAAPKAASAPKGAIVRFNGGEDIRYLAHDDKNVYVALAYSPRLIVIDKQSGKISQAHGSQPSHEVEGVVVAANACYFYVQSEGFYRYDPAKGEAVGPMFNLKGKEYNGPFSVSPDGHYIACNSSLIDVTAAEVISSGNFDTRAVNNEGGRYNIDPNPIYQPLNEDPYKISEAAVVESIYLDPVSENAYFACDQGFGFTPMRPQPMSGIKRIRILPEHHISCVTRDDAGNFVFGLRDGVAFGGSDMEQPVKYVNKLSTGVKDSYGYSEVTLGSADLVASDGQGNIIFASTANNEIYIYNATGLKGYSTIKGKYTVFE